jgi:hypothetical protein
LVEAPETVLAGFLTGFLRRAKTSVRGVIACAKISHFPIWQDDKPARALSPACSIRQVVVEAALGEPPPKGGLVEFGSVAHIVLRASPDAGCTRRVRQRRPGETPAFVFCKLLQAVKW